MLITRDDGASYYKPDLSEAHAKDAAPEDLVKRDAEAMAADLDAEIMTHRQVEAIDPAAHTVSLNGETRTYRKLVLANGAEPIVLNLGGDAVQSIHKVNTLADYRVFRGNLVEGGHVAIIGAGLIGCEFANDLIGAGYDVSVIDPAGWPLSQLLPKDCGRAVKQALGRAGVSWYRAGPWSACTMPAASARSCSTTTTACTPTWPRPSACAPTGQRQRAGLAVDRGVLVDRSW